MLERKLADMEKETQFLRLQAEAYQTVIQTAEEHGAARRFNIPIVKKPSRTGQAAEKLTRRYPLVGMELIYRLFRGRPRGPGASSLVCGYPASRENQLPDRCYFARDQADTARSARYGHSQAT